MYAHLVLKPQEPVAGIMKHGYVQDALTTEVCGSWMMHDIDGHIHVHMSDDNDWAHVLAMYRLALTRGGEQYWQTHEDELSDKLLFISENDVVTVEQDMKEVEERYGLNDIPDIYIKFENRRDPVDIRSNPLEEAEITCRALLIV
jgi:antirestriction protein